MKSFSTGNVVEWRKQLWVVAEDTDTTVVLIPMNSVNTTAYPSKNWPSKKTGRASIKFVAETVYGWIIKTSMRDVLGVKEALSADGWTPR